MKLLTIMSLIGSAGLLQAQLPMFTPYSGVTPRLTRGFHLYDVSASSVYLSAGVPNFDYTGLNSFATGGDYITSGSMALGWVKRSPRSSLSIAYIPSYMASKRYPEFNTFNHGLFINTNRPYYLRPRLTFTFGVSGVINDLQQFLFTPPVLVNITAAPGTFEDLAGAMMKQQYSNDQLASLLTGAPVVETPARPLFYGNRVLDSSIQGILSYKYSPRTTIGITIGGARVQHLASRAHSSTLKGDGFLAPQFTTTQVGLNISRSFNRRTEIGAEITTSRSFSRYLGAYITNGTVIVSRTLGRSWMLRGYSGATLMTSARQSFRVPGGPSYIGGGGLMFRRGTHTFAGLYDQRVGEVFGLGVASTISSSGAWSWHPRGNDRWSVYSYFSQHQYRSQQFPEIDSWRGAAGLLRFLTPNLSVNTEYVYLTYSAGMGSMPYGAIHAARVSLAWYPTAPVVGEPRTRATDPRSR